MRRRIGRHACFVVALSLVASVQTLLAAPPDPEFMAAKQVFVKEMRKKQASARADAVTALAAVVLPDTADLLLKKGLTDDDATVQQAARDGLRQLADDSKVRQYLTDELKKSFKKQVPNDNTIELFRALIVTGDEGRQAEVMKNLDDYLSTAKGNLLVPISVIDDVAQQGDAEAFRLVKMLSKSKAFDSYFGYRRCVIQAMSQIREPDAIEFLIDLMPKTQGLLQHDIIQYLSRVTKQKFQDNDRNWNKWWKENQAAFEFPSREAMGRAEVTIDPQTPTYYGIPICAKRIVFVLDTSGSMRGAPIDAAKTALLKAVESLPEAVSFDIVMFDNQSTVWQPRLVPANREAKQMAYQVIIERGLKFGTASNDALNTAFALEPEAIYFLSDGEPTDAQPAQIVSSISRLNKTRRVSIHTIGVVTDRNGGGGLRLFMSPLALQNYGTFQLVE